MHKAQTPGAALAAELRRYFSVGPRTRRYRTRDGWRQDLHDRMVEAIENAAHYRGYYHEPMQTALREASSVAHSYRKHVEGYRINAEKVAAIHAMTAWQFAAFLGQMVDAGIENVGQGEQFLNGWAA